MHGNRLCKQWCKLGSVLGLTVAAVEASNAMPPRSLSTGRALGFWFTERADAAERESARATERSIED